MVMLTVAATVTVTAMVLVTVKITFMASYDCGRIGLGLGLELCLGARLQCHTVRVRVT